MASAKTLVAVGMLVVGPDACRVSRKDRQNAATVCKTTFFDAESSTTLALLLSGCYDMG
jgi:hypothetical protein